MALPVELPAAARGSGACGGGAGAKIPSRTGAWMSSRTPSIGTRICPAGSGSGGICCWQRLQHRLRRRRRFCRIRCRRRRIRLWWRVRLRLFQRLEVHVGGQFRDDPEPNHPHLCPFVGFSGAHVAGRVRSSRTACNSGYFLLPSQRQFPAQFFSFPPFLTPALNSLGLSRLPAVVGALWAGDGGEAQREGDAH